MPGNRLHLVTGASGVVGPDVVRALLANGDRVRVLVRSDTALLSLPENVVVVVGDLKSQETINRAVAGVDVVHHLAAKLHVTNPGPELEAEYRSVNVEATERLLQSAVGAGVARFIFFSSIAIYGPSPVDGGLITEANMPVPTTLYARTKLEAEALVLGASAARSERFGVVLRLAAVYGSRMKGNYPRLVNALRKGRFVFVGSGSHRRTLVHSSDVASVAVLAATVIDPASSIYNVTDGSVHTFNEIVRSICAAGGLRMPRLRLPEWPIRAGIGVAEHLCKLVGRRSPITRSMLEKLVEDVAVSGELVQRELGFQPRVGLAEGWREALVQARKNM